MTTPPLFQTPKPVELTLPDLVAEALTALGHAMEWRPIPDARGQRWVCVGCPATLVYYQGYSYGTAGHQACTGAGRDEVTTTSCSSPFSCTSAVA